MASPFRSRGATRTDDPTFSCWHSIMQSPIDFLAANGTTMRHLRFRFASPDRATSGAADDDIAPGAEEPGPPFTGRADPFAGTMVTG